MNYASVFKESFNTFWEHKSLWLFGIVIAIVGQGDYGFSVNYRESMPYSPAQGMPPGFADLPGRDLLLGFFDNPIPYIIGLGLLGLVFSLLTRFVAWWSKGAVIGMVDEADHIGTTSVAAGWQVGKRRAIPLLLISILLGLPQLMLAVPVTAGGIWMFQQYSDVYRSMLTGNLISPDEVQLMLEGMMPMLLPVLACLVPLICVGGLLSWAFGLLNKVSARSCVLENLDVFASIKRGWQVMKRNVGYVLLTWFVLAIFGVVFGWVAAIPALVIWVPTARALLHSNWSAVNMTGIMVIAGYFIVVGFGVGGILTSFNSTLWTKLYKAFVLKGMQDKLGNEST